MILQLFYIISLNKCKTEIEKYFSNINFVIQDHKNYPGTGGAVMGIIPKYEKVLVLNGDMPFNSSK